jgi:predicted RNA-binding Zn-ribbon protein involved in translation (DUF1610 family)
MTIVVIGLFMLLLIFAASHSHDSARYRIEGTAGAKRKAKKAALADVACPSCGWHDTSRISVARKGVVAGAVGLFSIGYLGKTFHCNHCGYNW